MMSIRFTKMHGAGNDYIYIDAMNQCPTNLPQLSIEMSDRHKGVGADGLVVILPSDKADFRMRMFNADGSEGEMCGNASRCLAKFVYDKGLTNKRHITLETLAGIKSIEITEVKGGCAKEIVVDMGEPIFNPADIPVKSDTEVMKCPISSPLGIIYITAVGMGNPHGVVFVNDDLSTVDVEILGKEIQNNDIFPHKANIEFVRVNKSGDMDMRVYERGSGETMSCGTGACAALVAASRLGLADKSATVHLLGGDLQIHWAADNHVYLRGDAVTVFEGVYHTGAMNG